MNDKTLKICSKKYLNEASPKDFSDWAIYCLEQGFDSKNLRILASMFNAQYVSEVETYFFKSLNELNLDFPSEEKCLLDYAKLIAKQIINKEIDPIEGANEIYKVFQFDYELELVNWDYLINRMHPETYEDLDGIESRHLLEEAIIEEASKLIYGKKTTVHQYQIKPEFEFAEEKEGFVSKLWKKIF